MTIGRICVVSSLIALLFSPALVASDAGGELPVVKLSPEVRELPRDARYFQSIPCRELHSVEARSEEEQRHLDTRKDACLDQFRAFAPRSFQR